MPKKYLIVILILILFIASFLRLFRLGNAPVSMTDDEIRLVYNAYSIWNTGKDINGIKFPLSFLVSGYAFNPVAIYITSPFVGLLGLSMFSSRLPFAISGIVMILLVYLIVVKLLENRVIALLSSFALTFSVWHLQISRFAYEGTVALLFYLLGVYLFISSKKSNFSLSLSMFSFLIAFYSYSGTKLIFIPVILLLIWYRSKYFYFKQYFIVLAFILFALIIFVFLSKYQHASVYGTNPFFFQDIRKASEEVELQRRGSYEPEFLKKIYHNKLTYWSKIFIGQYSYAVSPQYLFTSQEASGIYSVRDRGQLYYIEAFLLVLGILYVFSKKPREFFLLFSFLILAPLPSALGAEPVTYTIRSSFMLPWLTLFLGAGIYSIYHFIKNTKIRILIYLFLTLAYIYLIGGYISQYYFNWVIYGSSFYSKASQDVVLFIDKEKEKNKMVIVSPGDSNLLLHYAFYKKLSPEIVQNLYKSKQIKAENILFKENCTSLKEINPREEIPSNSMFIISARCPLVKEKTNYIIKPDSITRSLNKEDEWLIFKTN
ncbi:hypothetical protein A3F29_00375 [Candidatus Roizmanbacteria bacterium RIFCSPHIGHO2_12_FULL_33_9]|uniref:Glycosyltransferase RgtA/B/C/D-like domain-containing protein n=1 Tax=Candidatus Roizmanbacteria bacterium RIFCSPHIGHO2_12_FULL_33_9 TaxID=1802045 RepID=A0A1F7HHJ4_9BACT|nr:MAG: hypothetical protein A3F29_00375 [Candidatus Roizmanbacteria bacterium RIFCSPHIGHO2_12_FULL_33_9]